MNNNSLKVFISATEQSGDNIGSNIIRELHKINPNINFDGIGGDKMKPLMKKQYFSIKDFKSIGIIEVLLSLKKYLKMISFLKKTILNNEYDLVITIDSPDFNYPLVKKIKKNGFSKKSIHIVAPSVWAWRKNRAKKFAIVYDEIFTLFEFENKFFEKYNLKSSFIGHPIFYIKSQINIESKYIAFLPGSRLNEVEKLFPYFEQAYNILRQSKKDLIIFIPTLPHIEHIIKSKTNKWDIETKIITDLKSIEEHYSYTSHALVCSGTASLEIAKRGIPQLVLYKLNFITSIILKFFINIKFANIFNIIENRMIIPELINERLNTYNLAESFNTLINDSLANKQQLYLINKSLKNFQTNIPPYELAAIKILNYL